MEILGALTLTHSSRGLNPERCSRRFLKARFGNPDRLTNLPAFASFGPAVTLYSGAVSFFRVGRDGSGRLVVEPAGSVRHRDRIQHVVWSGGQKALVGFEHRIELWELPEPGLFGGKIDMSAYTVRRRIKDFHLAGLHTVDPIGGGKVIASCSAPDAVLLCDLHRSSVERTVRMPRELYGVNYHLEAGMDLRRHYIRDECQTTHINAAFSDVQQSRVAVSTLIQGAVGIFDLRDWSYREVARGYVGCHGARFSRDGGLYFADSPRGDLIRIDMKGELTGRFRTGSTWLHDVHHLFGSVYAFAPADSNELRIYDIDEGALLYRQSYPVVEFEKEIPEVELPPDWLGNSTQSLSYCPVAGTGSGRLEEAR